MDDVVKIAKDWTILAAFASLISGVVGVAAYWAWRQYKLLAAIVSEFKPNGGSSLRDAINKIQSTVVIVDARQWAIVAGLRDPMWESDANGGCVRANRALLDLVQRNFDEMAGTGWENIIYADDRARVWQEWVSSVERKRTFESTYCVVDRANQRYRVQAIAIPFRAPGGEVVGYVGRYSKVEHLT
jgi:PAS domain-containing protein